MLFKEEEAPELEARMIPLHQIRLSPYQPRKHFAPEEMAELVASIRQHGVVQPVVVRPAAGVYELVAGERRVRAARGAGLEEIPAVVRGLSDREAALVTMMENLQRQDLSFLEEAEGYQRLIDSFGMTQEQLAEQVGKSQSAVANKLRLLRLPPSILETISREMISERHARCLLRLPDEASQREVLNEIIKKKLTVRATEQLVERMIGREKAPAGPRVVGVMRDLRIYLNDFRRTVRAMQAAGLDAEIQQREESGEVEIVVRVRRKAGAAVDSQG